jgi:hypothetical protein
MPVTVKECEMIVQVCEKNLQLARADLETAKTMVGESVKHGDYIITDSGDVCIWLESVQKLIPPKLLVMATSAKIDMNLDEQQANRFTWLAKDRVRIAGNIFDLIERK